MWDDKAVDKPSRRFSFFFPPNAACLIPADARGPAAHGACAAFGDGS